MTQLPLLSCDQHFVTQVRLMGQMYQDGRINYQQYKTFVQQVAQLLKHRNHHA